jgi:ParB family chromosome partitioning protein
MSENLKLHPRIENITTGRTLGGTTNEVRRIPIDDLAPNPYQPRWDFEEDALKELSGSIKEHGQIQPIVVCARDDGKDGYYIIAGERRWRACKLASLLFVNCIIQPPLDKRAMQIIALQENMQREDLHPVEVAIGMQNMVVTKAINAWDEFRGLLGFGHRTIFRYLNVAKLSAPVCKVAITNNYRDTHVLEALSRNIDDPDDHCAILQKVIDDGMVQKEAIAYIKQLALEEKEVKLDEPLKTKFNTAGIPLIVWNWKPDLKFKNAPKRQEAFQKRLQSLLDEVSNTLLKEFCGDDESPLKKGTK